MEDDGDPSVQYYGPFEGVEKRLVVEFTSHAIAESPFSSLREVPESQWQRILDLAACKILSKVELEVQGGEGCTTYLLSESSFFVYSRRLHFKTCGTTTPLLCLPALLHLLNPRTQSLDVNDAASYKLQTKNPSSVSLSTLASLSPNEAPTLDQHPSGAFSPRWYGDGADQSLTSPSSSALGFVKEGDVKVELRDMTSFVLFTHLDYCFPQLQLYPHRSFQEEVEYLRTFFPLGDFFQLAPTGGSHQFSVYFHARPPSVSTSLVPPLLLYLNEAMMLTISQTSVEAFAGYGKEGKWRGGGEELKSLVEGGELPGGVKDEYWFDPCGFSCNLLFPPTAESLQTFPHFMTTHISPETSTSYASVETTYRFQLGDKDIECSLGPVGERRVMSLSQAVHLYQPESVHFTEIRVSLDNEKMELQTIEEASACPKYLVSADASTEYRLRRRAMNRGRGYFVSHTEYSRVTSSIVRRPHD